MKFQYDRRQLRAMCFVASLAPVTRLLPKAAAQLAGSASWLAPLCALPPLLLFLLILTSLMKMRREGEGLGEVIMRRSGRTAGAIGLALIGSFTLFSAGFILRTGAHRLISTIYPDAGPLFFMAAMLIIGTIAALGPVKALPRASRVFAPVLLSVIVLALIFSLGSVDVRNLLPIKTQSAGRVFISGLAVVEIYGAVLYCAAFLEDQSPLQGRRFASYAGWLALICLLLCTFCAVIIGCYGARLTSRTLHPFFSMIRDVTLTKTVERIEALVTTLWVLSDFVIFTLLLCTASHIFRLIFGFRPEKGDVCALDMSNGRIIIPLCAALSGTAALLMPTSEHVMRSISQIIVPGASLTILFVILPLLLLIAKLRTPRAFRDCADMVQKFRARIFLCSILVQSFDIFRLKSTYRKRNFCTDSEQEANAWTRHTHTGSELIYRGCASRRSSRRSSLPRACSFSAAI